MQQIAEYHSVSLGQRADNYPTLLVENDAATAEIALHGGHVMLFQGRAEKPSLWLSETALYKEGKAIRGGVPICWPWFGDHPADTTAPAHGVVRQKFWQLESISEIREDNTKICLTTQQDAASLALWPHCFRLELIITISHKLGIDLHIQNTDEQEWTCGGALHSYFEVGDISQTCIREVEGHAYLNKPENFAECNQQSPLTFSGEVDRVYCNFDKNITIEDTANHRNILVEKAGSQTTVIWNPWQEIATGMKDMKDEAYREFVCIEPANAFNDQVTLQPGDSHHLTTSISIIDTKDR